MFNFAALTVALATSATVEMELGAKPIHATAGWSVSGPAPATAGLDIQFFVKQTNTAQLEVRGARRRGVGRRCPPWHRAHRGARP